MNFIAIMHKYPVREEALSQRINHRDASLLSHWLIYMEANEFTNWSSLEITATFQFITIALITRACKFALINGSTQLKKLANANCERFTRLQCIFRAETISSGVRIRLH
jgi:hypothetical protein